MTLAALARSPVARFVVLQIGWSAMAGGAAIGMALLGPLVIAPILGVQSWALGAAERRRLARTVIGLMRLGTVLDSLQMAAGTIRLAGAWTPWLAPLWITALWAHFATALPCSTPTSPSSPSIAGSSGASAGRCRGSAGS